MRKRFVQLNEWIKILDVIDAPLRAGNDARIRTTSQDGTPAKLIISGVFSFVAKWLSQLADSTCAHKFVKAVSTDSVSAIFTKTLI